MIQDVAVIGGSASGLLAASLLSKHDMYVTVFEASKHIEAPPRTLIVTHQLAQMIRPVDKIDVLNKIRRFELFANGRVAQISLKKPDLVIERSKLLNYLADNARQNGVKIRTSHRFLDVKPHGHHLTFKVAPNGSAAVKKGAAQIIIGADGAFSRVAGVCGWPRLKTVPLIQAVVKLPQDMPSDTTRVWFLPDDTPYFYWLIPHSPSEGVLGLIAEDMRRGRQSLERFIKRKGLTPSFSKARPCRSMTAGSPFTVESAAAMFTWSETQPVMSRQRQSGVSSPVFAGRCPWSTRFWANAINRT